MSKLKDITITKPGTAFQPYTIAALTDEAINTYRLSLGSKGYVIVINE